MDCLHYVGFSSNVVNFPTKAFLKQCSLRSSFPTVWPVLLFTHNPALPLPCVAHYVKSSSWLAYVCVYYVCPVYDIESLWVWPSQSCPPWPVLCTEWSFDKLTWNEWINQNKSNSLKPSFLVNERIQAPLVSPTPPHFKDVKIDKLVSISKFVCFSLFCFVLFFGYFLRPVKWSSGSGERTKKSVTGCDQLIVNTTGLPSFYSVLNIQFWKIELNSNDGNDSIMALSKGKIAN